MAYRQAGTGFTQIGNKILEKTAAAGLSGAQFAIVLTVWRYTYGYGRESHGLSEGFISKATKYSLRHVKRELAALLSANILTAVTAPTCNSPREIAFMPDPSLWHTKSMTPGSPADVNVTTPGGQTTAVLPDQTTAPPGGQTTAETGDRLTATPGGQTTAQEIKPKEKEKTKTCASVRFSELFDRFRKACFRRRIKEAARLKDGQEVPDVTDTAKSRSVSEQRRKGGGREDEEAACGRTGTGNMRPFPAFTAVCFPPKACSLNKRTAARVPAAGRRVCTAEYIIRKIHHVPYSAQGMYRAVHKGMYRAVHQRNQRKRKNKDMCIRPLFELFDRFRKACFRRRIKQAARLKDGQEVPDVTDTAKSRSVSEQRRKGGGREDEEAVCGRTGTDV